MLTAVNTDSENSGDLTASISGDGDRLVLTDSSGGGGTLSVAELNGSKAARDLGILGNEQGAGVLTGRGVLAGLNSVLLKNLNGGQGITVPGQVQLTDRSGVVAGAQQQHAEHDARGCVAGVVLQRQIELVLRELWIARVAIEPGEPRA